MPRHHMTSEGPVPFTAQEEAEWDEREKLWQIEKVNRAAKEIRNERNKKLEATDWCVVKAAETGSQISAEWATYRQALRDVPAQSGFPENVVWPQPPA